jgi:predicted AAA+ superfamily ATPase
MLKLHGGWHPVLRVVADRDPLPARFLLLGNVSPDLVKGVSESLGGGPQDGETAS